MNAEVPSLLEQAQLVDDTRELIRRTLIHVTGENPTDAEMDALVAAQVRELAREANLSGIQEALLRTTRASVAPKTRTTSEAKARLTTEQVREMEAAVWYATIHGIESVAEALEWYATHRPRALSAPAIETCIERFLTTKRCEGVRQETMASYRRILRRFAKTFAGKQPIDITPQLLVEHFFALPSMQMRRTDWACLFVFFRWAKVQQLVVDNPVTIALKRPRPEIKPRYILNVAETRELMERVKGTRGVGYWSLALFSGLRTVEIERIFETSNPWHFINLESGLIEVRAEMSKTRPRFVPISDGLREWLRWIKSRGAALNLPLHNSRMRLVFDILSPRLERDSSKEGRQLGFRDSRFSNIARRTFISHRMALPQSSYVDVSDECGNREAVLRTYYRQRVTRTDALAYFAIRPEGAN